MGHPEECVENTSGSGVCCVFSQVVGMVIDVK